jgi:hypothetical protein
MYGDIFQIASPQLAHGGVMKKKLQGWCVTSSCVLVGALSAATSAEIIHVNAKATGAGNGTSWTDAFTDLQPALVAAQAGDEVWVAAATYEPASPNGPRAATFTLNPGVALYGGFAGGESKLAQRDWIANPTTLSGDLNGDDGPVGSFINNGENSFHVVTVVDPGSPAAIIDGFTLAGGNANQPSSPPYAYSGGGLNIRRPASVEIRNCTFTANFAESSGGAIGWSGSADALPSTAVIHDCVFIKNAAQGTGGAVSHAGPNAGSLHIQRCWFIENRTEEPAEFGGGALGFFESPNPQQNVVEHCVFIGNQSFNGSVLSMYTSAAIMTNCLLHSNHCMAGGHAVITITAAEIALTNCTIVNNTTADGSMGGVGVPFSTISNCIIRNNTGAQVGAPQSGFGAVTVEHSNIQGGWPGTGNIDVDPLFVNATEGNFRLASGSPCIDVGHNALAGSATVDLDGNPRIVDGDDNGTAVVDIGAYEVQSIAPGDVNGDGVVDVDDLIAVILAWGACADCPPASGGCPADLDDDCDVDVDDLITVILNWGP